MKFVIPAAEDENEAELLYDSIKKFAVLQTRFLLSERRVFSIEYLIDGVRHFAEVGKTTPAIGEQVFAILETETGSYLVCTPNRCVYRNDPMLVESKLIRRVFYFEDDEATEETSDGPSNPNEI